MSAPAFEIRRAVVDDLPQLIGLWKVERLDWQDLEKHFTEFQVVAAPDGRLLGAIGLQVSGQDALMHSEVFLDIERSDLFREQIWKRFENILHNRGIARVWTVELAPYWRRGEFQPATVEVLAKRPAAFAARPGEWRVRVLRAEPAQAVSLDKELELFKEVSKADTEKIFRQARVMKIMATILASLLLLAVVVLAVLLLKGGRR